MAKTVGTFLTESPNLRKFLYAGLQKLIDKNVEISALSEPDPQVYLPFFNFLYIIFFELLCVPQSHLEK